MDHKFHKIKWNKDPRVQSLVNPLFKKVSLPNIKIYWSLKKEKSMISLRKILKGSLAWDQSLQVKEVRKDQEVTLMVLWMEKKTCNLMDNTRLEGKDEKANFTLKINQSFTSIDLQL